MGPKSKAAIGVGVVAVGLAGGLFGRHFLRARMHAIDAIPGDAFLVATFDVDALRRSPLGSPLFGGVASKLAGEKAVTELCGFDPLSKIREIAVGVPEEGEHGAFGIAVRADVSPGVLLECARKVIEAKKSGAAGAPTVRENGSYTLIEPDSPDADPDRRLPTLAYRDGGPFLIGRGPWLSTMIDTVEGRLPSVAASAAHTAIRAEVSPVATQPSVVATAVLPKGFRERLRGELEGELGLEDGADAPSSGAKGAIVKGVLGVGSVGVALVAGASGADSTVDAAFRCEDAAACAEVKRLVLARKLDWSQQISLRLLGLGGLLDSMKVDADGTVVHVSARAPTDDAGAWLDRVLTLKSVHHPTAGPLEKATPSGVHPAPSRARPRSPKSMRGGSTGAQTRRRLLGIEENVSRW